MQHIPKQIGKAGLVIDAFIIERLHLVVKEVLTNMHNPVHFEASLLKGCCVKQIAALKKNVLHGLIGSTKRYHS
jgi:hypothetical protein